MMRLALSSVFLVLMMGCGFIMINENSYRGLKESEKAFVKPFSIELTQEAFSGDTLFLYEITTKDVLKVARIHKYSWIHLWRPFCTSEYCQNIGFFSNLSKEYKDMGMAFLLVSETYDFSDIKRAVNNTGWQQPVYVLKDSFFGHKIRKNRLEFMSAFDSALLNSTRVGYDDYLFKDSLLLYAGEGLSKVVIDSLLHRVAAVEKPQ